MTVLSSIDAALGDLTMRLLAGNGLHSAVLEQIVGLPPESVTALEAGRSTLLGGAEAERLALFCAILIRLEIRLGHEPRAVREMIDTPQAALDGRTPRAVMIDGLNGLRNVHRLADKMALPQTRWWRVGHNR